MSPPPPSPPTKPKSLPQPIPVSSTTDPVRAFVRTVRCPPDGKCHDELGRDGVWRCVQHLPCPDDEPRAHRIYDAKPMPAELIKAYLDRRPWRQDVEDMFRGVDGRDVPQEQWYNPPEGTVQPLRSRREAREQMERQRAERKELEERVARGEVWREGLGPPCESVRSDYDLRLRNRAA